MPFVDHLKDLGGLGGLYPEFPPHVCASGAQLRSSEGFGKLPSYATSLDKYGNAGNNGHGSNNYNHDNNFNYDNHDHHNGCEYELARMDPDFEPLLITLSRVGAR